MRAVREFFTLSDDTSTVIMMDDFKNMSSDDPAIDAVLREAEKAESAGKRDDAIALYRKASDAGCSQATVHLAMMLIDGTDDERRMAISLLEKADEMGNDSATRNLGYCYAVGIGVEKDKEKAADLYIKAAEAGNARAMCNIGVLYSYGHGVPLDYAKAAEWYRRSAESGYSRGMTNYACALRDGKGVEKNPKAAEDWLWKAGSPRAKRLLAIMMLEGKDIPKNEECGRSLIEDAAKTDSKAMVVLGDLIVNEDRERAIELYTSAATKWNNDAKERLQELGVPLPEEKPRKSKKKD